MRKNYLMLVLFSATLFCVSGMEIEIKEKTSIEVSPIAADEVEREKILAEISLLDAFMHGQIVSTADRDSFMFPSYDKKFTYRIKQEWVVNRLKNCVETIEKKHIDCESRFDLLKRLQMYQADSNQQQECFTLFKRLKSVNGMRELQISIFYLYFFDSNQDVTIQLNNLRGVLLGGNREEVNKYLLRPLPIVKDKSFLLFIKEWEDILISKKE